MFGAPIVHENHLQKVTDEFPLVIQGDPNLLLHEIANDSHDQPKYKIYILLLIGLFLPIKCWFSHAVIFPDVHGGYLEVTICFQSFHQKIGAF